MLFHSDQTVKYGKYTVGWILFKSQNWLKYRLYLTLYLCVLSLGKLLRWYLEITFSWIRKGMWIPAHFRSMSKSACFQFSILRADSGMWYTGMENIFVGKNMFGHRYLALTLRVFVWVLGGEPTIRVDCVRFRVHNRKKILRGNYLTWTTFCN